MDPSERAAARRQKEKALRVRHGLALAILLAGVILLLNLLSLLTPDREYSETENRMLAQAPQLSASSLLDGSFFTKSGDHLADQLVGRDFWMSLNLARERFFGAKENGGVYFCRDRYLIQAPSEPNAEALARNLAAIDAFAKRQSNLSVYMTSAPNAFYIFSNKLPKGAPVRDQKADLSDISAALRHVRFVDVSDALLEHSAEYLYYRTDHHWTSLGAKYAFEAMAPAMGIEPTTEYDVYTVSNSFEGTLASKSGSHSRKDRIEIYAPTYGVEYNVTYRDTQTTVSSLYVRECLNQKDQYSVFFGGNHPRVDIVTTSDSGRSLLLFKDSYANCFVQFLTPYFEKIILIDARYYYDSIEPVLRQEGVTDVLFLYNTDTFMTDNALADVLESGS